MKFRVVDWNVNGATQKSQPQLLADLEWDVALLQEVTMSTWASFRALGSDGVVAFDHLPPLADGGPRYACAIVVRHGIELVDAGVLESMPSPERALTARAQVGGMAMQLCSWAAPPGVTWGDAGKGRQVSRFAAWLRARVSPVVVGIDRNAPKWERRDLADDEWWNNREPLLYGAGRVHDLRDVWRDLLGRYPQLLASVLADRPKDRWRSHIFDVASSAGTTRSMSHRSSKSSRSITSGNRRSPQGAITPQCGRFYRSRSLDEA
jgi:hypothetical protein